MAIRVELAIRNELSEVGRVADELARLAADHSIAKEVLADLQVVADEVLSNIIKYGGSESKQHSITVTLRVLPDEVTMEFVDDGAAFDPRDAAPPPTGQGLRDRPVGGLGIQFVKALMDGIEYERNDGRNCLLLRKKCITTVTQDTESSG
jgi:anti-sigma regulatory factor (Ser/Thr protein kinase)